MTTLFLLLTTALAGEPTVDLAGLVQVRAFGVRTDETSWGADLPRVRLKASGEIVDPSSRYLIQVGFDHGQASLKDAVVDLPVTGEVRVRAGQFKRNFAREFLHAAPKLALMERGPTKSAFGLGRDIGVQVHDDEGTVRWSVGAYAGDPSDVRPQGVVRVELAQARLDGAQTVDFEGGAPRLGLGIATAVRGNAMGSVDARTRASVDALMKAYGISVWGAVYASTVQKASTWTDQRQDALGGFAEVNAVVGKLVPALRITHVSGDGETTAVTGGAGVFIDGHRLNVKTDVTWKREASVESGELRLQLQGSF